MDNHVCHQVGEIAKIKTVVDKLERTIEGNGKPGLHEDVVTIKLNVASILNSIDALVEKREKAKINAWQRTSIIIAAIVGMATLGLKIIALIIK